MLPRRLLHPARAFRAAASLRRLCAPSSDGTTGLSALTPSQPLPEHLARVRRPRSRLTAPLHANTRGPPSRMRGGSTQSLGSRGHHLGRSLSILSSVSSFLDTGFGLSVSLPAVPNPVSVNDVRHPHPFGTITGKDGSPQAAMALVSDSSNVFTEQQATRLNDRLTSLYVSLRRRSPRPTRP